MSLPGSVTINTYSQPAETSPHATYPCRNPLWAIEHPDDCVEPTLSSIRVEPSSIEIVAGRRGHLRVVAVFSNGTEAQVTESSALMSPDDTIAEVVSQSEGVVRGGTEGQVVLTAAYRGQSATASVTVRSSDPVATTPWDVIFVLDQSAANFVMASRSQSATSSRVVRRFSGSSLMVPGYYWQPDRPVGEGVSIDIFDDLIKQAQMPLSVANTWDDDEGQDRFALVVTGSGDPYTYQSWTDSYVTAPFGEAYPDCALGDALERAQVLLASARSEALKLVVIFTAGLETSCSPSLRSVATTLKASGVKIAVITPVASSSRTGTTIFSPCSYPQTSYANLQTVASDGSFYGGRSWADTSAAFARVLIDAFEYLTTPVLDVDGVEILDEDGIVVYDEGV